MEQTPGNRRFGSESPLSSALTPAVTVREAIDDLPRIASGEVAIRYDRAARLEIIRHSGDNISCIPPHLITSGFSSCYSRLSGDEPSVTVTVNFVHPASNECIHPDLDRALTPREGVRFQSYDDDFLFAGTRTQIVKQIGNAVPPLLGQAIGRAVVHALESPLAEQVPA